MDKLKFAIIATDIVCFKIDDKKLKILVGEVLNPLYKGKLALIGGLIRPEETAIESIDRIFKDKAGMSNIYKEQLYTFDALDRDLRGRVLSVAYLAISQGINQSKGSIKTEWIDIKKIPNLAYDHNEIIKVALERLQNRLSHTNIGKYFLPKEFTLSDLQEVYEIIFNKDFDKRNFRKKILNDGLLKSTNKLKKIGKMRPALIYRYK